jgi:hypothetical protein
MRAIFGVLGLLVVLAIVALVAKKQLNASVAPATATGAPSGVVVPTGTPKQQVDQFQQAVQGAMQQSRPQPADDK